MLDYQRQLADDQSVIERGLQDLFRERPSRGSLYDAMHYSLLSGGKRIRPVLTLEVCRMCGGDPKVALPLACAVEMVHTYSLIHDDLPCMDDDDLRRGRPTNHKVYGEALSVLAGDALLTGAFACIAEADGLTAQQRVDAVAVLARGADARGMVGGQVLDIASEGRAIDSQDLDEVQSLKTGALLTVAAQLGCIAAGGDDTALKAVSTYAQTIGRAFQIRDDILDVIGDQELLGKPIGSDRANEKTTFASLFGVDVCSQKVEQLTREGCAALSIFEDSEFLTWLAQLLAEREH